jgi:hypothetical protein
MIILMRRDSSSRAPGARLGPWLSEWIVGEGLNGLGLLVKQKEKRSSCKQKKGRQVRVCPPFRWGASQ